MAMSWLRLILLVGGLLLIAVLVWLERRRPSRVKQAPELRAERNEPVLGFADEPPARVPANAGEADDEPMMAMPARGPDPGRRLPLIDRSMPPAQSLTQVSAQPPTAQPVGATALDAGLIDVGDISAVRTVEREAAEPLGEAQPLRVEWPPEEQRQIVSLRIVAARQNRISGRLLRQGLNGAGFQHGEFGIFHLGDEEGRVALSAASLVRPGLLDPSAMDFQSFSGINLFAVLPGPWSSEDTLERLSGVAAELAQRVEGRVQDERGMPFDTAHPLVWRERALAQLAERGAAGAHRPGKGTTANASHAGSAD